MKVTVTTTETKTSEVNVSFPAFTKINHGWSTEYHAAIAEDHLISVSDYAAIVGSIFKRSAVAYAFERGFEFIDESEFRTALSRVQHSIMELANSTLTELDNIQADAKKEHERDEYFEALDTDRAELEESLAENEFVDY